MKRFLITVLFMSLSSLACASMNSSVTCEKYSDTQAKCIKTFVQIVPLKILELQAANAKTQSDSAQAQVDILKAAGVVDEVSPQPTQVNAEVKP